MTVKDLIGHLRCYDENHSVNIEVSAECNCLEVKCVIDDVQFKHGDVILTGNTDY